MGVRRDDLEARVTRLEAILVSRRDRLLNKFKTPANRGNATTGNPLRPWQSGVATKGCAPTGTRVGLGLEEPVHHLT